MSAPALRLSIYDVSASDRPVAIAADGTRFAYANQDTITVNAAGEEIALSPDNGVFVVGALEISGTGWLFELAPADQPLMDDPAIDIVLSHGFVLDFDGPYMLRADRVASNPGAETPLHGHRGPGIRRLLTGRIRATIGGNVERIAAGQAWFETGRDWVIGRNISDGENVFVRVMVLPAELKGGVSSFVAATPQEGQRPRAVSYRLYGERDLDRDRSSNYMAMSRRDALSG